MPGDDWGNPLRQEPVSVDALEQTVEEVLGSAGRRDVILLLEHQGIQAISKRRCKLLRSITADRKTTTSFRAVHTERSYHNKPSLPQVCMESIRVAVTILLAGEEVEYCSIVPQGKCFGRPKSSDVALNQRRLPSVIVEAGTDVRQRDG